MDGRVTARRNLLSLLGKRLRSGRMHMQQRCLSQFVTACGAILTIGVFLLRTPSHFESISFRNSDSLNRGVRSQLSPGNHEEQRASLVAAYSKLPLVFEPDPTGAAGTLFRARGAGYTLLLTQAGAVFKFRSSDFITEPQQFHGQPAVPATRAHIAESFLKMQVVGANSKSIIKGRDELQSKTNYYIGSDRRRWQTAIPNFAKVLYREVYPGIDLVYYGNNRELEYDYLVSAGADVRHIGLSFDSGQSSDAMKPTFAKLEENGELVLGVGESDVHFPKPTAYQVSVEGPNQVSDRRYVEAHYVLRSENQVGIDVGPYDHTRPLVIDPVVKYSTLLGGTGGDTGFSIAVDSAGDAYVLGQTGSADFPTSQGAFDRTCGQDGTCDGTTDAVVTKFNPRGSRLLFSTYLGGSSIEQPRGIAADGLGEVYVTGGTFSSDFPVSPGAYQTASKGGLDAFITKLTATGSLAYSTFLGGSGSEDLFFLDGGIAVDASGDAYVTGSTSSTDFPTTPGAFQIGFVGYPALAVFVTKLNPTGSTLVFSTYISGTDGYISSGHGIAVDSTGGVYVTGLTESADFPTTLGAFDRTCGTDGSCNRKSGLYPSDAFVTKLVSDGSALAYSTYLGGSDNDWANAIALDTAGNAYLTGQTNSQDFPAVNAFQTTCRALPSTCAFVTKIDSSGASLAYSTYLGANVGEGGLGIAVKPSGSAVVVGVTDSDSFPVKNAIQRSPPGSPDGFITVLSPAGNTVSSSTFFGGGEALPGVSPTDVIYAVALDSAGNIYITGNTVTMDFPTTTGTFQRSTSGLGLSFAAKISPKTAAAVSLTPAKLDFGTENVGVTSPSQPAFLRDVGTQVLNILSIVVTGDFAATNNCRGQLNGGGECSISITFTPTKYGTRKGTLTVTDDAPGSPHSLTLRGIGQ